MNLNLNLPLEQQILIAAGGIAVLCLLSSLVCLVKQRKSRRLVRASQEQIEELQGFAEGIRDEGFTHAVVCGMGGSSLAPEVLSKVYPRSASGLELLVLDSTDPAVVAAVDQATSPETT